jgi:hypothetical protein
MLISAASSKLSNTVARYSDATSLLEARGLFFQQANLGADGGYNDRWVRVEAKPIPFYFPNTKARVAAARLHDLHHIAAEYETDWPGEAEIAAWEIASGCGRYYAAWLLNIGAFAVGLLLVPKRLVRAFVRGRYATNLYHQGLSEMDLRDVTVGMLRERLGLAATLPRPRWINILFFVLWCALALAWATALPLLLIAIFFLWFR